MFELAFYLMGNWCCIGGGANLLREWHRMRSAKKKWQIDNEKEELMLSRDLQVMLLIGSVLRVYWSFSPPAVWSEEDNWVQAVAVLDVLASPCLWAGILGCVGMHQEKWRSAPWWASWPFLTVMAGVCGFIGSMFLPPLDASDSWTGADVVVIWNMVIDGMAMVPQMYLIAYAKETITAATSHFVGLMCIARVFRMIFWATLIITPIMGGHGSGGYIWTFIIPDICHTILMGDYLYIYLRKLKRDTLDPYLCVDV